MKKYSVAFLCAWFLLVSTPIHARNDRLTLSISEAMNVANANNKLQGVRFYFGTQGHPAIAKRFGEFRARKKTNAFNKSDKEACDRAFYSALRTLHKRAISLNANAVIGIKSHHGRQASASTTEYQCGAGSVMAGVMFTGTVVTLGSGGNQPSSVASTTTPSTKSVTPSSTVAASCPSINETAANGRGSITKSAVNLRSGPATSCAIVGAVSSSDVFDLVGKQGNWYHISRADGLRAWLYAPYVSLSPGHSSQASQRVRAVPAPSPSVEMVKPSPDKMISIAVISFKSLNSQAQDISLGDMASETITTELVNSQAFKIIERDQLDKVVKEMELSQTGIIDTSNAVEIGKMLHADAIITGSIALLGNELQLNARIIEIESAYVISAESRTDTYSLQNLSSMARGIVANLSKKFYETQEQ